MAPEITAFLAVAEFPVDTPNKFPPADHLAHESLDACQRRIVEASYNGVHDFVRRQQAEIQAGRQRAVEHGGRSRRHRVFIWPEMIQAVGNEIVQPVPCLLPGGRPAKIGRLAGMVREFLLHQRDQVGYVRRS